MDERRAEFEAWAHKSPANLAKDADGGYQSSTVAFAWRAVQAATQRQQERIAKLERDLQFVERWANHHGAKPHTTAEEALSVIQHYPPITRITRGYADGVVPDTFDPYARIAELEAQVQALSVDAGRYQFATAHNEEGNMNFKAIYDAWDGDGSFTDQIVAAIAAGKGEA